MLAILRRIGGARRLAVSESAEVIRAEIFSAERLEQHAESLAIAQHVTARPFAVRPLIARLHDN
jgi:cyclic beta-1,2-glucan synthetase